MFQTSGGTPYMITWGIPTYLCDVSSVKIRNKHNFAICQPMINNLSVFIYVFNVYLSLKGISESQGGYMGEEIVFIIYRLLYKIQLFLKNRLQWVQNSVACLLTLTGRWDNIAPIFCSSSTGFLYISDHLTRLCFTHSN